MGAQAATLQAGLAAAAQTADKQAPATTITSPLTGAEVRSGTPITISGTATDLAGETEGGQVGGVEVSVDGGSTWHPAVGRENWTYSWTPGATGSATIRVRAADDSGNLESPGRAGRRQRRPAELSVLDLGRLLHRPAGCRQKRDRSRDQVSLRRRGLRHRSPLLQDHRQHRHPHRAPLDRGGNPAGPGHLHRRDRHRLAAGQLRHAGGDRRQHHLHRLLSRPERPLFLALQLLCAGRCRQPAAACLANGVDGPNGVYKYGAPGSLFSGGGPNTFNSEAYLVDVVFNSSGDTTPPTIISRTPANGASAVPSTSDVTATFSQAMDPTTIDGSSVFLQGPGGAPVAATVSYSAAEQRATLDPTASLQGSTTYTATIKGGPGGVADLAGNPLCRRFELVLHHRGAPRASPGRRAGRPDPGDLECRQPIQPLLRRDPAGRGSERVQGHRPRERDPGLARRLRRRDPRRDRPERGPGHDPERLGPAGRQPDRDAPGSPARRPFSASPTPRRAGQRLSQSRHHHWRRAPASSARRSSSTARPTATRRAAPRRSPPSTPAPTPPPRTPP